MDNRNVFGFANTMAQRAGLDFDKNQVDQCSIDVARTQTTDISDLATACVIVARGVANKLFDNKADCRMFATLAGRMLYLHRNGAAPTEEQVHQEADTNMYYLIVPTTIRTAAYKWCKQMLITPIAVS